MYDVLLVIHTLLVMFLIGFVLIQRTDSDGLSGLGGGGGNQFLTGRGSANLLTRTTAILAGIFMLTSLTLAIMAGHMNQSSIVDEIPVTEPTVTKEMPMPEKTEKPVPAKAEKKEPEAAKEQPVVPKPE